MEREISLASYSNKLREDNGDIWSRLHEHPFISGFEKGTLPLTAMGTYLAQDHLYVIDYGKCAAIAATKAQEMGTVRGFLSLANAVIDSEFKNQESLAREIGIKVERLEEITPHPTYLQYAGYMYKVAVTGTLGELASVLCPCAWSYEELGPRIWKGLTENYSVSDEGLKLWEGYSSKEYRESVKFVKHVLDECADQSDSSQLQRMQEHFRVALELEYKFWEIGLTKQ